MEVVSIMELLFDQDVVTKNYEAELYRDGMEAGMKSGMEAGMKAGKKQAYEQLVKDGIITKEYAEKKLKE
jgi:hypothetical protein